MQDICRICNQEKEIFISGICKDCFDQTNASFNKNNPYSKIHVIKCNKHGIFMGGSWNAACPNCIEEKRNVKCDNCNTLFRSNKRFDHIFDSINICNNCFNILPGKGNNIKRCKFHGFYRGISGNDLCPDCYCKEVRCNNQNCNKLLDFKIKKR